MPSLFLYRRPRPISASGSGGVDSLSVDEFAYLREDSHAFFAEQIVDKSPARIRMRAFVAEQRVMAVAHQNQSAIESDRLAAVSKRYLRHCDGDWRAQAGDYRCRIGRHRGVLPRAQGTSGIADLLADLRGCSSLFASTNHPQKPLSASGSVAYRPLRRAGRGRFPPPGFGLSTRRSK